MKILINRLHSLPIRQKVLMFGIVMSSIPLLLISLYYFYHTKADLEKRINEKQTLILKNLSNEIKFDFNLTFQRLQKLSLINQSARNDGDFYELLQENESIEEIVVTAQNGIVEKRISRYKLNKPRPDENWYTKEMWSKFQKNERTYGEVEFNEFGQPIVKLLVPLIENGERKGIGAVIQLQKIVGSISSSRQDPSSYLYLIDSHGKVIAHQDYSKLWQKKNKEISSSVLGVKEKIGGLNWTIVMEQPKSIAYKPINKMFQDGLLVVAILTFIISLISVYAGLNFTNPIVMLNKAMVEMKLGKNIPPLPIHQKDEMGKLFASFNEMNQEIRDKSRRIEQEKEQLNVVLDGIGAGLALVTREYKITWMNPMLAVLLENNQFHLPCYQLIGGRSTPCKDCLITCAAFKDTADKLFTVQNAKGEKLIFRHRVFPLTHLAEDGAEFLLFIEDVTKQKELEEKIVQTDKLAALGTMASSFAHEVNNPLTTINVYAEDLIDRIDGEDPSVNQKEISNYLKKIRDNTKRCKKITGNLLNFSRKSNWTQSNIDLKETVQNSISLVEFSLKKKKINISMDIEDIPPFIGDHLKLMQVFVNLLNNSIDSIKYEGTIKISGIVSNGLLILRIFDTGEGIPKEVLPKIFDPFFTTKPVGKGTGLGLSVCYGIIQQFGGTIQLFSEPNKGTTVEFIIPVQPCVKEGATWELGY